MGLNAMPKRAFSVNQLRNRINTADWTAGQVFDRTPGAYFAPHLRSAFPNAVAPNHILNKTYVWPFVLVEPIDIDAMGLEVTTADAASTIRQGLWLGDAANRLPGTLVQDSGSIDSSTTGTKESTFTAIRLDSHVIYWFGLNQSSSTPDVRSADSRNTTQNLTWVFAGSLQGGGRDHVTETFTHGALQDFGTAAFEGVAHTPYMVLRVA